MKIAGIGLVFAQGLGMGALETALNRGWVPPQEVEAPHIPGGKTPAYLVNLEALPDRSVLKKIRRSDKLSKMSVLAAADALRDCGIADITKRKLGLIVATAFGPHVTTFGFLDDILDHGDAAVSPTTFSNSVHNAAASYVCNSLGINGPTLTITQFRFSFQAALQLAQTWIDQGRCDYVLAGVVDQYGDVLGYVADHKLTTAKDGKIKPFTFKPTCQIPGEGAAFFLLGRENRGNIYCGIDAVHTGQAPDRGKSEDLTIIDADGMLPDETMYRGCLSPDVPAAAYAPLFGSMMIGSAFNTAAGALMIKKQLLFATPVADNPAGIRLLVENGPASVASILCAGYNCYSERSEILLTKV